ncbi:hypothetical protein MB02_00255 [Croceicoccus estronivorus]|uniref:TetR/AcrR family transcriptional regulator n=1 Tax=Croceicoccus estronivorus TaxID=1172626 RepID=UPI00082B0C6A|nr:TetR family transcriptional regulator [Croceicoccus estronivorus]OCC25166.1 hypothetical protein MB02_00255 [Croceicoccus estronivorus]
MVHSSASDERLQGAASTQPRSARVRHLLAVAREQFVAAGFEAVSIDAIARASGVSKETIYRYYPDKEALFRAAADAMGSEFSARVTALHLSNTSPENELIGLSRAILDSTVDGGLLNEVWVAIGVARIMPDFVNNLRNGQWERLEPVRILLEEIAGSKGVKAPVPLGLAVDFGSLSAESPALLMGFKSPAPAERDVIACRVAGLFEYGILAFEDESAAEVSSRVIVPQAPFDPPTHIRNLLDVAAAHFLESGYQRASLDVIGAEAAVGRGTLYRHFGSKAGLFAATMRDLAWELARVAPPSLPAGDASQAALAHFLESCLLVLGGRRSIALHRTVIAESRRDPALARDVYAILRKPWLDALIIWLESLRSADRVRVGDTSWYARQALVLSLRGNRVIAGGEALSSDEARQAAAHAAAIFLKGFAAAL